MNPISQEEHLPAKDTPQYATWIPYRSPEIKYQRRGPARNAIHYHFKYDSPWRTRLFKYDPDERVYKVIFDSHSELAQAVHEGKLRLRDALDSLDW